MPPIPNIHVTMKDVSANTVQQMTNALKAGTAPDVAWLRIRTCRASVSLTASKDISDCPGVAEAQATEVVPWTWSQVSLGGTGVYGMPQDTGPMVLYYRKDVFAKHGLTVPTTWTEYATVGRRLRSLDPSAYLTSFTPGHNGVLLSLMWQNGARPFVYTENGLTVDLVGEKAQQVSDYWQKMIDERLVTTTIQPFTPAENKAMNDGTLVTMLGASWLTGLLLANAPGAAGKWAVAPLPQWDPAKPAGANYGGSGNVVFSSSKHPAEAAEFATWIATSLQAQRHLIALGSVPPSIEGLAMPEMNARPAYFGRQPVWHVFRDASKAVDTGFQWSPNMTVVLNSVGDALTKALKGSSSLRQGLQVTQDKTIADLKTRGIDAQGGQ